MQKPYRWTGRSCLFPKLMPLPGDILPMILTGGKKVRALAGKRPEGCSLRLDGSPCSLGMPVARACQDLAGTYCGLQIVLPANTAGRRNQVRRRPTLGRSRCASGVTYPLFRRGPAFLRSSGLPSSTPHRSLLASLGCFARNVQLISDCLPTGAAYRQRQDDEQ